MINHCNTACYNHLQKNHNFSEKSFKNLLTNKCFNCNVRLMNDTLRPFRTCQRGKGGNGVVPELCPCGCAMMKIKKPKSAMKHKQNRKGTAQRRETGLPANTIRARSGGVHGLAGRRCSSVNRIEEKIKKCQKCQNPYNSGLNPVSQRRPSYQ